MIIDKTIEETKWKSLTEKLENYILLLEKKQETKDAGVELKAAVAIFKNVHSTRFDVEFSKAEVGCE